MYSIADLRGRERNASNSEVIEFMKDAMNGDEDQRLDEDGRPRLINLQEHMADDRRKHKAMLKGIIVGIERSADNGFWLRVIALLLVLTKVFTVDNVMAAIRGLL